MLIYDENAIRKLRNELSLSLESFAKKTGEGTTRQLVSQWERGLQMPNLNSLLRIVNNFQVPVNYFFKENGGT